MSVTCGRSGIGLDASAGSSLLGFGPGGAEFHLGHWARPGVDLGELGLCSGEADAQSFDFAGPAFVFGFGDAVDEVVADVGQACSLVRVWPEHRAADAPLTELPEGPSEFF